MHFGVAGLMRGLFACPFLPFNRVGVAARGWTPLLEQEWLLHWLSWAMSELGNMRISGGHGGEGQVGDKEMGAQ